MKITRLEELDLKAKSLLESWHAETDEASNGFGPQQQSQAGSYSDNKPFHKFGNQNHKRQNAIQDRQEIFKAGEGGFDAFFAKADEISARNEKQVGPPTLEERWLNTKLKGGPASEAKGGGSSNRYPGRTSGVEHKGEQSAGLSVKFGDVQAFVPDNPENRDLFEGFKKAYQTGKNVSFNNGEDGDESLSMLDIFFRLSDNARMTKYGAGTIRELYDAELADGNAPTIQATKILRRNQWSQEDMSAQYDEGRTYAFTDSYYRYDVTTPDLEFGNADDPLTKQNHQSFTLRRKDANTIELATNIQRATVQNPSGNQWPNKTEHGSSTFTRSNSYDHRMKTSVFWRNEQGGREGKGLIPTALAWPEVSSVPPNKTPFADNRPAKNLEELWFSLTKIKTAGPYSEQVQRPGTDSKLSTIFSANNISAEDYKVRFLGALNGSFANVPNKFDVGIQGARGFNVGQVAPYTSYGRYVFGNKREMDVYDSGVLHRILSKINTYEQNLMEIKPGGNRINIVFNIRMNLDKLLQQNLLMPTDIHPAGMHGTSVGSLDLATAIEEGVSSTIDDDTFSKLYLKNRSALHASDRPISNGINYRRNPPGTIAGVPVASLQGAPSYQNGNETSDEDDNYPVFRFTEDKKRNNPITKDRGFIDNISGQVHGNRSGIAGLMPAVENDPGGDFDDETSFLKTRGRANEQFFPFMFETVNKKGSARAGVEYKQYAYFQATLQNLNESYAPAWSSKHFFGRTEQVHTYTMTDRTMDLSFVIFATEIRRLQNLYERVSWLAQQTYPSYDVDNRMKSGPLIRMSIGDMFSNLTGFIRSLSFDWNYLGPGGKWEITQGLRIPMACTVTMNFTVMHDDMPDRNYAFYPGMLEGGSGLMGDRGKTKLLPNGGPLIATAERVAQAQAGRRSVYSNLSHRERYELFTMTREERTAYANRKEAEAVGSAGREQQYIDSLYDNRSTGDRRQNTSGEMDLVF